MVSVRLEKVTKRFGRVVAVNKVSLDIEDGKLFVLLGPSGSGKSTLLYLIAGIYKPTSGRIYFDGRDVTELPPSLRNVGLVFQNYALYPHMKVFDNIAFPLKLRRLPASKIESKVSEVAKLLHIEELLDRYPAQLSGGQQQRVALARALVKEPAILLLDEPLSNLDALLRIYIRAELKRLQRDLGITAVYVTHDQSEALAIADSIVVINNGVVQQIGSPETIYNEPRNVFVATFIGNPPSNIVRGSIPGGEPCVRVLGGEVCFEGLLGERLSKMPQGEIIVTFRPEHIKVGRERIEGALNVEAEVYEIEPLGRESIMTFVVEDAVIKAVAERGAERLFRIGEKVNLSVKPEHINLFDPETEVNLKYLEM